MDSHIKKTGIMNRKLNAERQRQKGGILFLVLLFMISTSIGVGSLLYLVTEHCGQAKKEIESVKAFYLAETGIQRGMYRIKEETPKETADNDYAEFSFEVSEEERTLYYKVKEDDDSDKLYKVTGMASFGDRERTLQADVVVNPPWEGYDYGLFSCSNIFNYAPMEYHGNIRANGACRFYDPTTDVYGDVYASQYISGDCQETGGEDAHRHQGVSAIPLVPIDLNYYEDLAIGEGGTVKKEGVTLISQTFTGNIYLEGGHGSYRLVFDGPVVVRGDVIIHGIIAGQGTLYAGRNIYIANDLRYYESPLYPAPVLTDESDCDAWVRQNRTMDLVILVAKENIVFGDYTSQDWKDWMCEDVPGTEYTALYGTTNKGEEDRGKNFIWDTEIGQAADEGEDDNAFGDPPDGEDWSCNYEDLDRDGSYDNSFVYSDFETQDPFISFTNSPGGNFSDIATNEATKCDAVLYSPHVICGLSGSTVVVPGTHHGTIACDEHLHWYVTDPSTPGLGNCDKARVMYDPRVFSSYRWDPADTNYFIDSISLPVDEKVAISTWEEIYEDEE